MCTVTLSVDPNIIGLGYFQGHIFMYALLYALLYACVIDIVNIF